MSAAPIFELGFPRLHWMTEGTCRQVDPDLWHPEKGGNNGAAKRICRTACPVIDACLAYALTHPELEGIWGGTSEWERRDIRVTQLTPEQHQVGVERMARTYKTRKSA